MLNKIILKSFQMGTSRDRSYLGQLLNIKKSIWIPIEEDIRNFFLQLKTTLARKLPFHSLDFSKNSQNKLVQIVIEYDA